MIAFVGDPCSVVRVEGRDEGKDEERDEGRDEVNDFGECGEKAGAMGVVMGVVMGGGNVQLILLPASRTHRHFPRLGFSLSPHRPG